MTKLIVVIPIAHNETQAAISLAHALKACGTQPNPLLIVTPFGFDSEKLAAIRSSFTGTFARIETVAPPIALADESFPFGTNWLFETAARHIAPRNQASWLWLPTSAVPMRKTWLSELEASYTLANLPFLGQVLTTAKHSTPFPMLAATAVYPPQFTKKIQQRLVAQRGTHFEQALAELVVPFAKDSPLVWVQPPGTSPAICGKADVPKDAAIAVTSAAKQLVKELYGSVLVMPNVKQVTPVAVVEPSRLTTTDKEMAGKWDFKVDGKSAAPAPSPKTYYHSGNLGDVIYALYAIKKAGGGALLIGPQQKRTPAPSSPIKEPSFDILAPLLTAQPYITKNAYSERHPGTDAAIDLNAYRTLWEDKELRKRTGINTILRAHCHVLGVDEKHRVDEPWLNVPSPIKTGYIVCHRSQRYQSTDFPWPMILKRFANRILFVGLPGEYAEFRRKFGERIAYWQVTNLLELARIVAGADGFIGNQSFPMAVALGCGQRVVQEVWEPSPDCLLPRANLLIQPTESQLVAWERSPRIGVTTEAFAKQTLSPLEIHSKKEFEFHPNRATYPTVLEQTPWPCGFFEFKDSTPANGQKGIVHFNPSVELIKDKLHLFTRRFEYSYKDHPRKDIVGTSTVSIWSMDKDKVLSPISRPNSAFPVDTNQWDDPRTLQHNGSIYVSAITWNSRVINPPVVPTLYKLNPTMDAMSPMEIPVPKLMHIEKNWLYFVNGGIFRMIYTIEPFSVYDLGVPEQANNKRTENWSSKWFYGLPRGGSNPILYDGQYWTFFHSSLPWKGQKRRYFMGALAFDGNPPFSIKRFTMQPLLAGSEEDPRDLGGPCVVFPGGAVMRDGKWFVVFGVNDERCAWIEIPHAELERKMTKI